MYKNFTKRLLDVIISFTMLLCLSPLIFFVACWLWVLNNGKPFFVQERPGKGGRIFKIIKFKTMTDERNTDGQLLPDSARITPFGSFVRRASLDELPQLINVLKGEMSLIGPRPLLPDYLPLYDETQRRRHEVRPGITGWAQVNGRNEISWARKFELDVWYVDHLSVLLDIKIIFLTLKKVVRSEGISSKTSITMEPFTKK